MKTTDVHTLHNELAKEDAERIIIDVRTPEEYMAGHVPQAVNIPLDILETKVDTLREYGTIYVICGSGMRSERGCDILKGTGLAAINVAGGTGMWRAAGYFVESE